MASILDRYGIKEVADVTFYKINDDGTPGAPVLFLDTLKVSTIEQSAEQSDARGGKGNPKLITWDYGKEMNVTLEDALFSPKSMALMMGSRSDLSKGAGKIEKVAVFKAVAGTSKIPAKIPMDVPVLESKEGETIVTGAARKNIYFLNGTTPDDAIAYNTKLFEIAGLFKEDGTEIKDGSDGSINTVQELRTAGTAEGTLEVGKKYFLKYVLQTNKTDITINADVFPGTYYVTGDTYVRSDITGEDQFFQFIIPKAKMTSEQTITLQAEGDPATFNMNLTVLRPEDGNMMKLVQYDIDAVPTTTT